VPRDLQRRGLDDRHPVHPECGRRLRRDDNNARIAGATLDITGATGAQGVTTSSGKEFVVVAGVGATEETLVRINMGKHHDNKAQ
jgi:hypothetical protein